MDFSKFIKEREGRVDFLKNALKTEFSRSDFDPDGLGITRDMVAAAEGHSYAPPKRYPTKGEHPRVYFNLRQMDGIYAAIENPECRFAVEALFEKANADGDSSSRKDQTKKIIYFRTFKEEKRAFKLMALNLKKQDLASLRTQDTQEQKSREGL